jgi:uncharacterized protein YaaW (UPF0174 family)
MLSDVCDHVGVKYEKGDTTETIELSLLMKMLEKSLSEMSPAELREFADSMGTELTVPTVPLVLMAIQTAVRASGFAAYRLSVVMLSTLAKVVLGRSLSIATYLTLTRSISVLAGPVGIALSTGWLIADIAGPAYRITVPACLLVACLRQQFIITSSNSRNYSLCLRKKNNTIAWHHGWRSLSVVFLWEKSCPFRRYQRSSRCQHARCGGTSASA